MRSWNASVLPRNPTSQPFMMPPFEDPPSEPILGTGCDEARFSEKKGFSVKRGRQFSESGLAKDLHRKANSVKRFGPFTEPPDSEN